MTKERWLEARKAELLPVPYFHSVFTLPHELNPVILCNKKVMLRILFKAVSKTLLEFGVNPETGITVYLQTLLRERKNAPCLLDTGRIQPQWI